jgi:recombination protein RecT
MTEITILDQTKNSIFKAEKSLSAVLPKNFDVKKFMATLWMEVQKTPKLAECENLLEIARDVASFGLIVGGQAQQAYLIPFNKKFQDGNTWKSRMIAQLIIGYKGYITKLEEAGYTVEVEIVTKKELEEGRFEEIRGSETKIIHKPIREGIRDRDNIALAYCIIKGNGTSPVISVLSKEEIEEMAKTDQYNTTTKKKEKKLGNVWIQNQRLTDYGQMCIKTVIRNCVKKVNLRIANEMSAYEGEKEKEMIDITPSKTANIESLKFENGESLDKDSPSQLTPEDIADIEKLEKERND